MDDARALEMHRSGQSPPQASGVGPMSSGGRVGRTPAGTRSFTGADTQDRSGSPFFHQGSGSAKRTSSDNGTSAATYNSVQRSGRSSSAGPRGYDPGNAANAERTRNYSPEGSSQQSSNLPTSRPRRSSFDTAEIGDPNLGPRQMLSRQMTSQSAGGSFGSLGGSVGGPPGGSVVRQNSSGPPGSRQGSGGPSSLRQGSNGPVGVLGGSVGIPGAPGMAPLSNYGQGTLGFSRDRGPATRRSQSASGAALENMMRTPIPEGERVGGSVALLGQNRKPSLPGRSRSMTEGAPLASMADGAGRPRSASPQVNTADRGVSPSGEQMFVPSSSISLEAGAANDIPYSSFDRVNPERSKEEVPAALVPEIPDTRDTHPMKLSAMFGAWVYCVVSWVCGVSFPFSVLDVMPHTAMHWSMTRSVTHTLSDLVDKRCWFPFFALSFFSLGVPLGKLSGTCFLIYKLMRTRASDVMREHELFIHVLNYLASYQFVDLYCGILFVCYFNSDASDAQFKVGFYWFFSYCIMSLALSVILENTLLESVRGPDSENDSSLTTPLPLYEPVADDNQPRSASRGLVHKGDAPAKHHETYPDLMTTRFFSGCFISMFIICIWDRFLEVRMLMHTVAVERTVLSLKQVLVDFLPQRVNVVVVVALWLLIVFFPLAYTAAQLVRVEHRRKYENADGVIFDERTFMGVPTHTLFQTGAKTAADLLRQWAHIDVVAVASLIFLFMLQDENTLTMTPDGSVAFYLFLAASFSFFFLRWFTETSVDQQPGWAPAWAPGWRLSVRFGFLVGAFVGVCIFLCGGVPGAAPHFQYRSLDSVCEHARPLFDKVTDLLPAAYGNCDDLDSNPPQPCIGSSNLQTSGDDKAYMNAIWMGGLKTMRINDCSLSKVAPQDGHPGTSSYRFHIGGNFDHISMFLRVKQCMPVGGCVKMNSANHCCGDDISFNFTFGLNCQESPGSMNAIRSLKLINADLGQMLVNQKYLDGAIKIQAMDISGQVEKSLKDNMEKVLDTKIKWGKRELDMGDMLNRIVQYNAPADAGQCF